MKLRDIVIIAWQKGQLSEGKAARLIGVDRLTLRTMRDELITQIGIGRCPFCGNNGKLVHVPPTNSAQSDEYRVECGDCGSCGRASDDKSKAVEFWNKRFLQQETFQQAVINDPDMTYEQKKYWLSQPAPCGHSYLSTVLDTKTGETYCGECKLER